MGHYLTPASSPYGLVRFSRCLPCGFQTQLPIQQFPLQLWAFQIIRSVYCFPFDRVFGLTCSRIFINGLIFAAGNWGRAFSFWFTSWERILWPPSAKMVGCVECSLETSSLSLEFSPLSGSSSSASFFVRRRVTCLSFCRYFRSPHPPFCPRLGWLKCLHYTVKLILG